MAVAASVLAVIGFGSFVYFTHALPEHASNPVAVHKPPQGQGAGAGHGRILREVRAHRGPGGCDALGARY